MEEGFEEIPHTADVALHVWGQDLAQLFVHAAQGLAWLIADPAGVEPACELLLELSAYDTETLLVAWLSELLYLHERDGLVFVEFDLQEVSSTHLAATVRGGEAQETRRHIKAVTFSELDVRGTERGLETNIVFDV